ncbi:flagellar hook assembly protein FlgD [Roseicyclus mahoneyensis]|uniref:Basal-body rod modification protein FlgD n=1 Tax=Roseicyclus mahoneyensis TaxID=164332 RepID=A0A316GII5_9RHOB|nr:flagellar hook capping FlgD N-terminal domain-containing protein [Roseicyclus mahoneyensis]PWK60425.1 flagellar basal-body rod modification protein FlgD [Roseicyclus mahoneyensis]
MTLSPTTLSNAAGGLRDAQSLVQTRTSGTSDLGQGDFLLLMTTQLQNQDPFAPMENGEFLAQMAQFSTVSGLESVNQTLGMISGQIGGSRIATGASLLGQQVLVPGTLARPDDQGAIHGVVELPESVTALSVRFIDPDTGETLHTRELGPQQAGLVGFSWDAVPDAIAADRRPLRLQVIAEGAGGPLALGPSVYARIVGVQLPQTGSDLMLNIEDYGVLSSLEVNALR